MTKTEIESPTAETRQNPRRLQPLEIEYRAGRINGDLWLTSDRFERAYRKAAASAVKTFYRTIETPAEKLIGPEVVADAMLECRYIAFRLGALYSVMVRMAVEDRPFLELAGESFPRQSTKNSEMTNRGRERAVCALRMCEMAHNDFDEMKEGKAPRLNYALGHTKQLFSSKLTEAANDNARSTGNVVHQSAIRRWRLKEQEISKALANTA